MPARLRVLSILVLRILVMISGTKTRNVTGTLHPSLACREYSSPSDIFSLVAEIKETDASAFIQLSVKALHNANFGGLRRLHRIAILSSNSLSP